jgi:hypothetical protein
VWHFLEPVDLLDVLEGLHSWGDTPMHAEVLLGNDAANRQTVEAVHQALVDIFVILFEHFLTKREHLGHLAALVVASKEDHILGVVALNLVTE